MTQTREPEILKIDPTTIPSLPYSPEIRDHLAHPRNRGTISDADGIGRDENPVCGDIMTIWVRIEDGAIATATFEARGCDPSLAAGSLVTELITGMAVEQAAAVGPEQIDKLLGGLPRSKRHAAHLAVAAMRNALAQQYAGRAK